MKLLLALVFAAASFAGTAGSEPRVSASALKEVETATNTKFAGEPWDLLGDARGSYLPGYGAVFTLELSLIRVTPITPFHQTVSADEVRIVHERKLKQLVVLKETVADLIVRSATALTGLPPAEQITFEAYLLGQPFEIRTGLPHRSVMMTANRQKLLDAAARHATPAEVAALIEVREE